jgi:hypothetical protein
MKGETRTFLLASCVPIFNYFLLLLLLPPLFSLSFTFAKHPVIFRELLTYALTHNKTPSQTKLKIQITRPLFHRRVFFYIKNVSNGSKNKSN